MSRFSVCEDHTMSPVLPSGRCVACIEEYNLEHREYLEAAHSEEITELDVEVLMELQGGECIGCFVDFSLAHPELSHIVPLSRGGRHCLANLQLLCKPCVADRGDLPHEDWISRVRHKQVMYYLSEMQKQEITD